MFFSFFVLKASKNRHSLKASQVLRHEKVFFPIRFGKKRPNDCGFFPFHFTSNWVLMLPLLEHKIALRADISHVLIDNKNASYFKNVPNLVVSYDAKQIEWSKILKIEGRNILNKFARDFMLKHSLKLRLKFFDHSIFSCFRMQPNLIQLF